MGLEILPPRQGQDVHPHDVGLARLLLCLVRVELFERVWPAVLRVHTGTPGVGAVSYLVTGGGAGGKSVGVGEAARN